MNHDDKDIHSPLCRLLRAMVLRAGAILKLMQKQETPTSRLAWPWPGVNETLPLDFKNVINPGNGTSTGTRYLVVMTLTLYIRRSSNQSHNNPLPGAWWSLVWRSHTLFVQKAERDRVPIVPPRSYIPYKVIKTNIHDWSLLRMCTIRDFAITCVIDSSYEYASYTTIQQNKNKNRKKKLIKSKGAGQLVDHKGLTGDDFYGSGEELLCMPNEHS